MSRETSTIQVEIFGQTYRLRAEEDPEYVEKLAAYVDEKMREMSRQTSAVDTLKVAVLAALNIADERHRVRETGGGPKPGDGRAVISEAVDKRLLELDRLLEEAITG